MVVKLTINCQQEGKNLIFILKIFVIRKLREASSNINMGPYELLKIIKSIHLFFSFSISLEIQIILQFFRVDVEF